MLTFDELFDPSSRWYFPSRFFALVLLGLVIYYQTFAFGFVFDDKMFIVNNPYIKDFKDIHLMWIVFPKTRLIGIYTFAFNYHFGQLNPRYYHFFNFFIHLLTTSLVWALTRMLFKITGWLSSGDRLREELAFIVALLFLVHPGQTQAVTYITQRFESIAAMFYMASLLCYVHGRTVSINLHKFFFFAGTAVFGLLGILTKETAVTIPATILAIELILLNRDASGPKKSRPWPLYLLIAVLGSFFVLLFIKIVRTDFSIYFHFSQPSESHDGDIITGGKYLLTQMRVILTFLRLLALPVNQNLDYDYPLSTGLLDPPLTLVGLGVVMAMVFLIVKLRKYWPLVSFGLAWILITFSINTPPRTNVIFEHKLYLISFGFFLAIVCTLAEIIKDRKLLFFLLIALVVVLSLASYKRNQVWRNELTLWEDVVAKSPHKARPYTYRGVAYMNNGYLGLAISDFTKVIEIDPKLVEAYNDRAAIYIKFGNFNKAIADYNKAVELEPNLMIVYYNRGLLFARQGRFALAVRDFSKVITMKPDFVPAYGNLGIIYANQGALTQAVSAFTKAIEIDPHYASAFYNRDKLYYLLKEYDKAWEDVHQAEELGLKVEPGFMSMLQRDSGRMR